MTIVEEFNEKKYVHIKNFIGADDCKMLTFSLKKEAEKSDIFDSQCKKSKAVKCSPTFDQLLIDVLPYVEDITGKKLLPTYAYARWYVPGEELKPHTDRDACEISATITLGFEGDVWPIFLGKKGEEENSVSMQIGDAVVYYGCELEHWRNEYTQGQWQAQVFLHYVDANGEKTEWMYDKNPKLNIKEQQISDLSYWYYDDVMTDEDCNLLIKTFSNYEGTRGDISDEKSNSKVDNSVRNVVKFPLPVYKGIGAILTAVGLNANQQRWKFDITKSNQCEFLHYPPGGGRYKSHIDVFLNNDPINIENCRKLTVLAFLNDDYKGGRFFLQIGSEKFYPPQQKGTVIVFPSFVLHGVEDVEEGERFSVVAWLVGPWFK